MVGDPCRKSFRSKSIQISNKCLSQAVLRSFYKPCSKQLGPNISVPILIQHYEKSLGSKLLVVKMYEVLVVLYDLGESRVDFLRPVASYCYLSNIVYFDFRLLNSAL